MATLTPERIEELRKLAWAAREARFIELGRSGANHDLKHPHRAEWERLRALLQGKPLSAA